MDIPDARQQNIKEEQFHYANFLPGRTMTSDIFIAAIAYRLREQNLKKITPMKYNIIFI